MRFLHLLEKYSPDNIALMRYMRDREIDIVRFWEPPAVAKWLQSDDNIEEQFSTWVKQNYPNTSIDDAIEDYDLVFELPPELQKSFEEFVEKELIPHYMGADPTDVPTWAHMYLRDQNLLPPDTWLIHFSYEANKIAEEGFKYGIDDMDRLALTTWFNDDIKKSGGFNFAFVADSNRLNLNYGTDAVLFQNSGVHAYHVGDEENQVMFWGKDVDPRSIVFLYRHFDIWKVMPHPKKTNQVPERMEEGIVKFEEGNEFQNLQRAIDWVKQNLPQYRRYITGY